MAGLMDGCLVGWVDWWKEGKVLYSGRETRESKGEGEGG